MGSKAAIYSVVRSHDKTSFNSLLKIAKAGKCGIKGFSYRLIIDNESFKADPLNPDDKLRSVLDTNGLLFQILSLDLDNDIQIVLSRPMAGDQFAGFHDQIHINPQSPQVPTKRLAEFVGHVQSIFTCIDDKGFIDYLKEEDKAFYLKRDSSIQRLEEMQETFFDKIAEFGIAQATAIQTRVDELDKRYDEKHADLEAQHQRKLAILAEREQAHEQRLKDFEAGENRLVRRKIREDVKKTILERNKKFQLTWRTRLLRLPIAVLYIILAGFFGYFAITLIQEVQQEGETGINYFALARQVTMTAACAATVGFNIKWNNQWFRDHADEEFKLKRFELDFDRASWVVEMAMEWNAEKGTEIPPFLIERLSSGIFAEERDDASPLTPADALASAIFGSASAVKVKAGDAEIQLDRKGVERLNRRNDA